MLFQFLDFKTSNIKKVLNLYIYLSFGIILESYKKKC